MKTKHQSKLNRQLLKKYLNGTCTDQELVQVRQFLQSPESFELFQEILDEAWQEMEEPELDLEAMAVYRELVIKEHQSTDEEEPHVTNKLWSGRWIKYAAVLILPILFGLYQFSKNKIETTAKVELLETYNPKGTRSKVILSDGTMIYLGSNSKIRYPKVFAEVREMELVGEAFFNVKKDPLRPFIIHTNNIQTKVLGTSFKIEAFQGKSIEVSVATGKVTVDREVGANHKHLKSIAVLSPGHLVNWDEQTQKITLAEVSAQELELWKDGVLTFNNQRLADVAAVLERRFNVHIRISSNTLSDYRINTTCSLDEPIMKIIDIMGKAGDFNYSLKNDQIILSN